MIKHLYIKDFVLIPELFLDFEKGFHAVIGETGAGKSILIDAISLLYKDRANASYIAKGKEKALIEVTVDLSHNPKALHPLLEAGFESDGEVTFTREISVSGKNTVRIDHRISTVTLVRDCLSREIDIHNQRDTQYLLDSSLHIDLLDAYLNLAALQEQTKDSYRKLRSIQEEKHRLLTEVFSEDDLEYFHYQINEIDEAHLSADEEEELESKEKEIKQYLASSKKIHDILACYDSVSDALYSLQKQVQGIKDGYEDVKTAVVNSYYALDDAMERIRDSVDSFEYREEEISGIEERLFLIQKMKRKYGGSVASVLEKREEIAGNIERFEHRQQALEEVEQKLLAAAQNFNDNAMRLRAKRAEGKQKLENDIRRQLKDLALPHADFSVHMEEGKPSEKGIDQIEFYISMNRGEDLKPLARVASGGELSRLMLGLKVIFTRLQELGTVIFDEIDTGVSGPVATTIGRKMMELSAFSQVFSVTHLAPVAACATDRYLVKKSATATQTVTSIHLLSERESIEEIAKIASGNTSEAALLAAKELLERNGGL